MSDQREVDGWTPEIPPVIVCAANQYGDYILTGARHWDRIMRMTTTAIGRGEFSAGWKWLLSQGKECQGFIDQFGRFYTREEAELVARQNDQIDMNQHGGRLSETALHSEDLY